MSDADLELIQRLHDAKEHHQDLTIHPLNKNPRCTLCAHKGLSEPAIVDAWCKNDRRWLYMCLECFSIYGKGLGRTLGQVLI